MVGVSSSLVLLWAGVLAGSPSVSTSVHAIQRDARPAPGQRIGRTLDPPTARATFDMMVYGYYAPWAGTVGDLPWDRLTHVAIFSVDLTPSGTFTGLSNWHDHAAEAITLAEPYEVSIHLAVTSFNDATMSAVLGNATTRATAVEGLRQLVDEYGAHGVAVDFEGMSAGNRDDLVAFCTELSAVVDEVTVATPAVDWAGAYDYDALAIGTDGVFIMGYDYHYKGGDPGPVAPLVGGSPWGMYSLQWSVDDYITWGAPPDKIILGLPLYGYAWPTTGTDVPGTATGTADAVLFADAVVAAEVAGRQWDDVTSTPYYFADGATQAWYDDTESLDEKIALAVDEGLGGIGFWAVNYEGGDPEFWDMVAGHTQTPAPDPDPDPDPDSDSGGGDSDSGGQAGSTGQGDAGETAAGEADPQSTGAGESDSGGAPPEATNDDADGCACTTGHRSTPGWLFAAGLLLVGRGRQAGHAGVEDPRYRCDSRGPLYS